MQKQFIQQLYNFADRLIKLPVRIFKEYPFTFYYIPIYKIHPTYAWYCQHYLFALSKIHFLKSISYLYTNMLCLFQSVYVNECLAKVAFIFTWFFFGHFLKWKYFIFFKIILFFKCFQNYYSRHIKRTELKIKT